MFEDKLGLRSCGKNVTGASEKKKKKNKKVKKRKAFFTYKKKSLKKSPYLGQKDDQLSLYSFN